MRTIFKNALFAALTVAAFAVTVSSCKKLDDDTTVVVTGSDTLRGTISADRVLRANRTYFLSGTVLVKNNAKLTIEPGTLVKAIKGTGAVLIITKGSQLIADGTPTQPIVFTSNQPVGGRQVGDWGGIVLVGRATVNSVYNGVPGRKLLEGFDATAIASLGDDIVGGGSNDADNSGILRYVRIEYSGIPLSSTPNSELNGLSMIAVGNGTLIDYVQVSFSGDDSFEWWGGTVNAKHLIAFRGVDDDFDTDNGFRGKVQFGLSVRDRDLSDVGLVGGASNGFESDNEDPVPSTLSTPLTAAIFSNITVVGPTGITGATLPTPSAFNRAMHIRRGTQQSIMNSVFFGFPTGLFLDGTPSQTAFTANDLQFRNNILAGFAAARPLTANNSYAIGTNAMNSTFGNDTTTTVAQLNLANLGSLTGIDPRPTTGSALLNKASFTSNKFTGDTYFSRVTFLGAFDVNDNWMASWTEFNPGTRAY